MASRGTDVTAASDSKMSAVTMPRASRHQCKKNDINAEGIPTCHTLSKHKPTVVNYIEGAVQIPRGFDKVKRLRFQKNAVEFVSHSGKTVTTPVQHSFITTGAV